MALPSLPSLPSGLSDQFAEDALKQTQWNAFLRNNRLAAVALDDVVARLHKEFEAISVI